MRTNRIEILDPLRGLAALAVTWHHLTNVVPKDSWLSLSGRYGWLGVEVFFVISGFIIVYSLWSKDYEPRRHYGRFILKRLMRLEPPYFATIALALLVGILAAPYNGNRIEFTGPQLLAHVGYANALLGYPWIIGVFWTLAIEAQFYLLAGLCYPLLASRRLSLSLAALAVLTGVGLVLPQPSLVFRYGGLFALGIAAFHRHRGTLSDGQYLLTVGVISAVTAYILSPLMSSVGLATAMAISYVKLRPWPVLTYLGSISYSLYLVHCIVGLRTVNLGMRVADSPLEHLALMLVGVGVSVASAHVMWRLVELPSLRWANKIAFNRERATRPVFEAARA
jgi:peptidoglycan/LPS O-acetylase OafA/YrhL